MPRSVNQPNRNDSGICISCIHWNFFRRMSICPSISMQFHIISQLPRVRNVNFSLITFATDEMGETPSSPFLVIATPIAEINRLMMKRA